MPYLSRLGNRKDDSWSLRQRELDPLQPFRELEDIFEYLGKHLDGTIFAIASNFTGTTGSEPSGHAIMKKKLDIYKNIQDNGALLLLAYHQVRQNEQIIELLSEMRDGIHISNLGGKKAARVG